MVVCGVYNCGEVLGLFYGVIELFKVVHVQLHYLVGVVRFSDNGWLV